MGEKREKDEKEVRETRGQEREKLNLTEFAIIAINMGIESTNAGRKMRT